ncbi:hypothetical protein A2U01_0082284, partial [Trifolium medium]|nr:hypothetical protein [Trifolium medium]
FRRDLPPPGPSRHPPVRLLLPPPPSGHIRGNNDLTILHHLQHAEPFSVELSRRIEDLELVHGIVETILYPVEDFLPKRPDLFDKLGTG